MLASDSIRLVPLGGLGQVGMNCLCIEQEEGILVVDCGVSFGGDDAGVDVYHPEFSWLLERAERVSAVFLTHGHEDHIGALPFLLREIDVPVYGPPHALGLAERRLSEHDFGPDDLDLRVATPGDRYSVGPFQVEPVRVAHSIVEASALGIWTRAGLILHSGDFNFDPDPPDGEPTDEGRLRALGDEGVDLLLSDSTNIDVPERPGSENAVAVAVRALVEGAQERVVIGLFASNVQRLITLGETARRTGRRLCLMGRSLQTQVEVATAIGRLCWPSDLVLSPEKAQEVPRHQLLVLAGGSQAEPNSALYRLATGQHPRLRLDPGDTVILSSRAIPGNERAVVALVDAFLRAGMLVHSRVTDPAVHTSGHAGRSEQRRMIELLRPRSFLPVHGTLHHLLRHAELAREAGVASTLVVENGKSVLFDGQELALEGTVPHGRVAVAQGGEPLSSETLRARAELGRGGIAMVSLVLSRKGRLATAPEVATRGVPALDDDPSALRAVALEVARVAEGHREGRGLTLAEAVRRAARRKLEELSGTRPVTQVFTTKLDA